MSLTDPLAPLRSGLRSGVRWGLGHGLPGLAIRQGARGGDLVSRLVVEPGLRLDPFPAYESIRADAARTGSPFIDNGRLMGTVDHAAATEILRSEDFGVAFELPGRLQTAFRWSLDPWAAGPVDPPSMLAVDPPVHGRYRRLVTRWFTAREVRGLEDRIIENAERLLHDLAQEGSRVDLIERYAALLPVAIIAEILGVPAHQHAQLLAWGNGAAITLDPALTWGQYREAQRHVRALHIWLDGHLAEKRRSPGADLLSALATLEDDDLTDLELRGIGLLVLGAGFETTVNLIGNAVAQVHARPAVRDAVRDDPALWGGVVEETLRFDSPVQLTFRSALKDTVVAGAPVRRGTGVLTYLGGANRDPAVFADPADFDPTRSDAGRHLAFSSGVHYCLGAGLARAEATIGLRLLHERFPDLRPDGEPTRRPTRVLRGYERMPVTLR